MRVPAQRKAVSEGVGSTTGGTPAPCVRSLTGKVLSTGWVVGHLRTPLQAATGGCFSVQYTVTKNGHQAFMKVLDYGRALASSDPAAVLKTLTEEYIFERELHRRCTAQGMSRIARFLDAGKIEVAVGERSEVFDYLIFEWVRSDLRLAIGTGNTLTAASALRLAHQVACALRQLHSAKIAHQDLKPSNVLVPAAGVAKLTDLGRAFDGSGRLSAPHDEYRIAGDAEYAPPELLYGTDGLGGRVQRFATDLYLLGNVVMFLCFGVTMNGLLFERLESRFHCDRWTGTYGEVLPYLRRIVVDILADVRTRLPKEIASDLAVLIGDLCSLEPGERREPRERRRQGGPPLERYITRLDLLARRAEVSLGASRLIRLERD